MDGTTPGALWLAHKRKCGRCGQSAMLEALCAEGMALHADADAAKNAPKPPVQIEGQCELFEELST